jgi:hypothetical protein
LFTLTSTITPVPRLTATRIFGIFTFVKLLGAHGDTTSRTDCSWQFADMSLVAMTMICAGFDRGHHGHHRANGHARGKERIH